MGRERGREGKGRKLSIVERVVGKIGAETRHPGCGGTQSFPLTPNQGDEQQLVSFTWGENGDGALQVPLSRRGKERKEILSRSRW